MVAVVVAIAAADIGSKMKISQSRLQRIIREEIESIISNDAPSDAVPVEDALAGGDNLEHPIDHVAASGFPEQPDEDELRIISIVREELSRSFPRKIRY